MDIKPKKLFTLVFVFDDEKQRLLLGLKKRGFGAGKINGFGGKVEANESIVNAAVRELNEECGLSLKTKTLGSSNGIIDEIDNHSTNSDIIFAGVNTFNFVDHPILFEVHIFRINYLDVVGDIIESNEMRPEWFNYVDIPYDQMWPDDRHWFPSLFNKNVTFNGYYLFESIETDIILEKELKEVMRDSV